MAQSFGGCLLSKEVDDFLFQPSRTDLRPEQLDISQFLIETGIGVIEDAICANVGVNDILDHFKLQDIHLLNEVGIMQEFAEDRHQEVLGLIDALSDGTTSDRRSLGTPKIAILGAGGMGKTSLARAVLHHPTVAGKYAQHSHLVDSEGCPNVLASWEEEKTSVISDGYDKRSNLDLSISMSPSSPQITSVPHCQELLSLLSMLPDGLSDIELVQSKLPINDILRCKAALLSASLAYSDDHRQFKSLVPIREYMARSYPPMDHLVQALLNYFHQLLGFWYKYFVLVEQAIEQLPQLDDSDVKCQFYNTLGEYYRTHNDFPTAITYYQTRLSLAILTGNTKKQCQSSSGLAYLQWYMGDPAAGQKSAPEAQKLAHISADLFNEARALEIEAHCWQAHGNHKYAVSLCNRARDLLAHCGMSAGDLDNAIMGNQAEIHKMKSEYVEARDIHRQRLHGAPVELAVYIHAFAVLNIAEVEVFLGVPMEDVERKIDTAKSIFNSLGYSQQKLDVHKALQFLGDMFCTEGDQDTGVSLLTVALEGFTQMDVHRSRAECMLQLGYISKDNGDVLKATEYWQSARSLFDRSSQAKKVVLIDEELLSIARDVLEEHARSFTLISVIHAPSAALDTTIGGVV
ncbi:hypothetical protein DFH09DRAFT_1451286 [Mycena vulgaris]|nr:hypothetical protein DFH09DRAFT_1451286 [Mycena vulgaris]